MEQRKVTAENLEKAETYIPLARKYAIVQILAPGCIEQTESGFWRENIIGRSLVGCYILAGFYLHLIDTSGLDKEKPEFQFTLEDYDRLNKDTSLGIDGQTAQEIMRDYEKMKGLLDQEISARLAEKNDPFNRFQEALRMGLTPDVVQELQKAVEAAKAESPSLRGEAEAIRPVDSHGGKPPRNDEGEDGQE